MPNWTSRSAKQTPPASPTAGDHRRQLGSDGRGPHAAARLEQGDDLAGRGPAGEGVDGGQEAFEAERQGRLGDRGQQDVGGPGLHQAAGGDDVGAVEGDQHRRSGAGAETAQDRIDVRQRSGDDQGAEAGQGPRRPSGSDADELNLGKEGGQRRHPLRATDGPFHIAYPGEPRPRGARVICRSHVQRHIHDRRRRLSRLNTPHGRFCDERS